MSRGRGRGRGRDRGWRRQSAGCNAHRASLAKMGFSSVFMLFVCFSFWFLIFHIHFDFDLLLLLLQIFWHVQ